MHTVFRIPRLIAMIKKLQDKNTEEQVNKIIVYIQKNICSHGTYDEIDGKWMLCSGCGLKVKDKGDAEDDFYKRHNR